MAKAKKDFPHNIAIIMDGNGRWATSRGLMRFQGHAAGVETVRTITEEAVRLGVKELTLYAFSSENWRRPRAEVTFLMHLLKKYLKQELKTFLKNNIRFRTIGDASPLAKNIKKIISETHRETETNEGMILRLAISYGGRAEIAEAMRKIAQLVAEGKLKPEDITEETIAHHLYDPKMPDPDLIIRTSGENRMSNFLLWQGSYSEFWVTDVYWPDFNIDFFHQAIEDYRQRERRFGAIKSSS